MVFSGEYLNGRAVNAIAISKKYLSVRDEGLYAISIFSNMKPQLYKQLQCKLKCYIVPLAVALFLKKLGI